MKWRNIQTLSVFFSDINKDCFDAKYYQKREALGVEEEKNKVKAKGGNPKKVITGVIVSCFVLVVPILFKGIDHYTLSTWG